MAELTTHTESAEGLLADAPARRRSTPPGGRSGQQRLDAPLLEGGPNPAGGPGKSEGRVWGTDLATLAQQLAGEFGRGFELTNLTRMLKFAEAFPECRNCCHAVATIELVPLPGTLASQAAAPA